MSEKWKQKTLLIFPFAVLAVGHDTYRRFLPAHVPADCI